MEDGRRAMEDRGRSRTDLRGFFCHEDTKASAFASSFVRTTEDKKATADRQRKLDADFAGKYSHGWTRVNTDFFTAEDAEGAEIFSSL